MNKESLIKSLTIEDLQAILKGQGIYSSGADGDLQAEVSKLSRSLSWKYLLISVPKESLQRICASDGLRSDLTKDELIDQIIRSFPKPPKKGLLRDLFSPWQRWEGPGSRRSR
jgi:hypothetical protein